jgi:hypothetical protein
MAAAERVVLVPAMAVFLSELPRLSNRFDIGCVLSSGLFWWCL